MKHGFIQGVHHVSLKPTGYAAFEKTVAFYRDVLGLEVVRSWGTGDQSGIMLKLGESLLEISASGTDQASQGAIHHYALATDDVDAVVAAVKKAGYPVTMEPTDKVLPTEPPYPIRIAFFTGPCSETVELFCER